MTPAQAAREAARIVGSQTDLAKRLAVSAPTVSQWCSGDRPIPPPRALQIEALTKGQVKRGDLCPSFPWSEMVA
ncbi:transcriptional regulator [Pseudomonas fragi]|nr:Cro/CI family transcriptional regulator [Pseudomonas fragi]ARQ75213.1 transcriptional regulator [Pseudomonas fragi]PAA25960.1 transcriptional regulator [Pseudomonas fragi]